MRNAVEIVTYEQELAHMAKLRDRDALYGVASMVELNFYVDSVRQDIEEERLQAKNVLKQQRRKARTMVKQKVLHEDGDALDDG